jgi:hypothetical protein
MVDPVMDLCGHSFERRAIEGWINRGNTFCPISQKELTKENLIPNDALAERIEKWTWEKEHAAEMMMILKTLSDEQSTDSDDEEGLQIELGQVGIFRIPTNKRNYTSVNLGGRDSGSSNGCSISTSTSTTNNMLLPQEREALEAIRQRNLMLKQQQKRRKTLYVSCGILATAIILVVVGLYWVYTF